MRSLRHPPRLAGRVRSSGTVLALVLIVLVIMMLGGVAMFRAVDTSALLSGNLAFKRDATNRTSVGLNAAFSVMKRSDFTSSAVADCVPGQEGCDGVVDTWLRMNYSPRLLESDGDGIPLILKDKRAFDAKFTTIQPNEADGTLAVGIEVRFLIERMCTDFGPVDEKKCSVPGTSENGGSYRPEKPGWIPLPFYRITIRSDGARNTQTYVQATVTTLH